MKKLAIVILAVVSTSAFAMGPGHKGGERMAEHMQKQLELTDEQTAQIQTIFTEQGEKMKALHEETREKINAVLTPEQQDKLAELKEKRKERWEERKEKWMEKKGQRGE
ncbi:MAG: hypothetical protein MI745_06420 [Pseudomonadales bacterium]|nr:hypothetical protein [Pseudomonadales bacterium]